MPKLPVYNQEGKQIDDLALSDKMFGVKVDQALVHEVMVASRANARRTIASTKTKGEIRGGGKKPWKQKGTGRARQGSIRSPQWIGGGIVFGPDKERNFEVKINKKTKQKALFMALSDKVADQKLIIVDQFMTEPAKTKLMAAWLKKLPVQKTVLLVAPGSNPGLVRMVRNLQNVKCVTINSVGLLDVLTYRSIVFLKDAIPAFERLYSK
ncbi:50S ribosomal protein L4 [Candidatus Uhrbacteria bacterium]|nr:50S ribosomal protein L4 [Candidatus Uhrbacteria bacterium]